MRTDSYHGYRLSNIDFLEWVEENGEPVEMGTNFIKQILRIELEVEPTRFRQEIKNYLDRSAQMGDPFSGTGSGGAHFTYIVDLDKKSFEIYNAEYSPTYSYEGVVDRTGLLLSVDLEALREFHTNGWNDFAQSFAIDHAQHKI